jgi:uncharacterized circularly permuted ATP-grasp superfamily protein/uncharacterized alpha-E superfamily protein
MSTPDLASPGPATAAAASGARERGLFGDVYTVPPGIWDELHEPTGRARPHWRAVADRVLGVGSTELDRLALRARQHIHDNGVTYNVYGDPRGAARPAELDLMPMVLEEEEWARLERGLAQRARLIDRLLADVYGPQEVLRRGLLPATLVHAHPEFLRPAHGVAPPGGRFLHLYGADLARGPDGRWMVLADRARTPSGAGYALENRIVTSRVLPEAYRDAQVHRLAPWFDRMRNWLYGLAPWARYPRVAMLTPGPYNETYFEHAYLARYLGFTLVQGGDLVVRDDCVFLKTLGGLERVDVIVRRVDDEFCDPLELRGDSALGVAGLLQAARRGNVAISNALGTGLAETPALLPFLPALARHLLGEELLLPSVETWWCGDAQARESVIGHLDRLVVKPTFPRIGAGPTFTSDLGAAARQALAARIATCPFAHVAQARVPLSTAPSLVQGRLEPRPMVLRAFLVATDDGGYAAMPGGLARISPTPDTAIVSMQHGGTAKDAWVLAPRPVAAFSLLGTQDETLEPRRVGNQLPSRVADDLFWVGRYAERAEAGVRGLRALLLRLTDGGGPSGEAEIAPGLAYLAGLEQIPGTVRDDTLAEGPRAAVRALAEIFDPEAQSSLACIVKRLMTNASMVRDRLSLDMWRTFTQLDAQIEWLAGRARAPDPDPGEAIGRLDTIVTTMAALNGMANENMTRGQAWRFLDAGRRLERAMGVVTLVRALVAPADGDRALDLALELADSSMTYRARYFTTAQLAPVLDLLLCDEGNPRSLAYQVAAIANHVGRFPRERDGGDPGAVLLLAQAALAELRGAEVRRLARGGPDGRLPALAALLEAVAFALPELSETISATYFRHALAVRPAGPIQPARAAARP